MAIHSAKLVTAALGGKGGNRLMPEPKARAGVGNKWSQCQEGPRTRESGLRLVWEVEESSWVAPKKTA